MAGRSVRNRKSTIEYQESSRPGFPWVWHGTVACLGVTLWLAAVMPAEARQGNRKDTPAKTNPADSGDDEDDKPKSKRRAPRRQAR